MPEPLRCDCLSGSRAPAQSCGGAGSAAGQEPAPGEQGAGLGERESTSAGGGDRAYRLCVVLSVSFRPLWLRHLGCADLLLNLVDVAGQGEPLLPLCAALA